MTTSKNRRSNFYDHLNDSRKIGNFIEKHGVTTELNSKYCINAFTMKDETDKIIAVKKFVKPSEDEKFITLADFQANNFEFKDTPRSGNDSNKSSSSPEFANGFIFQ